MIKDDYLTISQVAEKLSFTRQTVHRYIAQGKLKAETVGRTRLISKDQIVELLYEYISEVNDRIAILWWQIKSIQGD